MSEPIIINGVDVSKCKHFKDKWVNYDDYTEETIECETNCCLDSLMATKCEEINNCYYKQLLNLKKANELLFKMAILTVNNFANTEDYNILKYEWFDYFKNRNIKDLREYKNNIMDRLKNYKKVAHDIDKEIEKRLKNGEVEE